MILASLLQLHLPSLYFWLLWSGSSVVGSNTHTHTHTNAIHKKSMLLNCKNIFTISDEFKFFLAV